MAAKKKQGAKASERRMVKQVEADIGSQVESAMTAEQTMAELTKGGDKGKVERIHQWVKASSEVFSTWRENFITNARMLSNDQWPDEDRAEREAEGRPCLNINKMLKNMMIVAGIQSQARQEPKLLPQEPGDELPTEIMGTLLKWRRDQNKAKRVDSRIFFDKCSSGLGWWKAFVDFEDRPQGDIRLERLHPLSVFPDPNFLDSSWEKANWVIQADWYSMDQALEEWPEKEKEIRAIFGEWLQNVKEGVQIASGENIGDSHAVKRSGWDAETQRVRVLEVWYRERTKCEVAILNDTGEVIDDEAKIKELKATIEKAELEEIFTFVKRPVKKVRVCHVLDRILLDDQESPYPGHQFPIFPSVGYYFWKAPFGLCDVMRDPQMEKNKRRSAIVELVGRMPLSGFFNKEEAGADPKDLEAFATGHGVVVGYKSQQPELIKPAPVPDSLVLLEQQADREIDSTVNVNAELQGQTTSSTSSGKAIEARQRGGVLTHETLFDSFNDEVAAVTEFLIELIQEFITPGEALRVLGRAAMHDPDGREMPNYAEADEDAVLEALSKTFTTKYDVVVSSKPMDPTIKLAQWETIKELRQSGMVVPDDIMVDMAAQAAVIDRATADKFRKFYAQQAALQARAAAAQGIGGPPSTGAPPPPMQ